MQKNPQPAETGDKSSPAAEEPPLDNGILAWLEDLLIKMIFGIFRFSFVKVPSECYRALVKWFPTLIRLAKVLALSVIWLFVSFGPLIVLRNRAVPQSIPETGEIWNWCAWGYTAVAICGSVWGAMYVRRRKRSRATPAAR